MHASEKGGHYRRRAQGARIRQLETLVKSRHGLTLTLPLLALQTYDTQVKKR